MAASPISRHKETCLSVTHGIPITVPVRNHLRNPARHRFYGRETKTFLNAVGGRYKDVSSRYKKSFSFIRNVEHYSNVVSHAQGAGFFFEQLCVSRVF